MSPRPDVSEERKAQILEAAINVFARLGIHNARMDDIVAESGLSKGALYWYFKSKDEIIISILGGLFEREFEDLQLMLESDEPVSERLVQFITYTLSDIQQMLKIIPLAYEFYALAFRNQAVGEAIKGYFRRYLQILTPIIQEGIDSGEFKPAEAQDIALTLGAVIEGTILLWVYDSETVDLDHQGKTSIQLLLKGIQTKDS